MLRGSWRGRRRKGKPSWGEREENVIDQQRRVEFKQQIMLVLLITLLFISFLIILGISMGVFDLSRAMIRPACSGCRQ
jgi:hypothetical protein